MGSEAYDVQSWTYDSTTGLFAATLPTVDYYYDGNGVQRKKMEGLYGTFDWISPGTHIDDADGLPMVIPPSTWAWRKNEVGVPFIQHQPNGFNSVYLTFHSGNAYTLALPDYTTALPRTTNIYVTVTLTMI
jgi:hypothetical protein